MRKPGLHLVAASLAAGVLASSARADDAPRFEVTPFAAYRAGGRFDFEPGISASDAPGGTADIGDAGGFGLDLGLYRDADSFYELLYSRQQARLDARDPLLDRVDVTVEYYQFGGTMVFRQSSERALPYLSLTIGATRLSADGYDSDTRFSASLGGGLRVPFNSHVAAVLGLRGYLTFVDSSTEFLCISDASDARCLLKASGSTLFQAEAQLGIAARF